MFFTLCSVQSPQYRNGPKQQIYKCFCQFENSSKCASRLRRSFQLNIYENLTEKKTNLKNAILSKSRFRTEEGDIFLIWITIHVSRFWWISLQNDKAPSCIADSWWELTKQCDSSVDWLRWEDGNLRLWSRMRFFISSKVSLGLRTWNLNLRLIIIRI